MLPFWRRILILSKCQHSSSWGRYESSSAQFPNSSSPMENTGPSSDCLVNIGLEDSPLSSLVFGKGLSLSAGLGGGSGGL